MLGMVVGELTEHGMRWRMWFSATVLVVLEGELKLQRSRGDLTEVNTIVRCRDREKV